MLSPELLCLGSLFRKCKQFDLCKTQIVVSVLKKVELRDCLFSYWEMKSSQDINFHKFNKYFGKFFRKFEKKTCQFVIFNP